MAKVAQIVGDTTEKLLADAQRFEGAFPRELFEGFYGQFVDTMKTEMRRAGFVLDDWLGNKFTVFIAAFTHRPHGRLAISAYRMELQVVSITNLFGSAYTGN